MRVSYLHGGDILNTEKDILKTYSLRSGYDGETVLRDVSINFPSGKTTFVLGANGAGKSTLFLTLNGVIRPLSGSVAFCGEAVRYDKKSLKRLREKIGIVFQDPDDQLFCPTVYEDITFGAVNMGLDELEIRRRADCVMKITETEACKDKSIHALSFGQKKRTAIAGALITAPKLLLLDEPTAGLDPKGAAKIMRSLNDIKKKTGVTVVVSTHDMDMAPVFAEHICLLDGGRAVFCGSPEDFFKTPQLLRKHGLRLPRISHLFEILNKRDGVNTNASASTISAARKELLKLIK